MHTPLNIDPILDQARARLLSFYHGANLEVQTKNKHDLVTSADLASEAIVLKGLREISPDIFVVSEEDPTSHQPTQDRYWVVDPLDGTLNFAHGLPIFGISVALVQEGQPVMGWIDLPCLKQRYFAERNKGAFVNGQRIHVSDQKDLSHSMVALGQPHTYNQGLQELVSRINQSHQSFRRTGSAVFNFAMVASGALDVFFASRLGPWDVAAGVLMVEEAGGVVQHHDGQSYDSIFEGNVIASNGHLDLGHLYEA